MSPATALIAALPGPVTTVTPAAPAGPAASINAANGGSVLPGTQFLSQLASGIGSWALIAAVVGIFVGAIMWAFGSYSQNYQQAYNGRRGVMVSGLAALLVGVGPYLIGFFFARGQGITS